LRIRTAIDALKRSATRSLALFFVSLMISYYTG
jgi:hypothetical protein